MHYGQLENSECVESRSFCFNVLTCRARAFTLFTVFPWRVTYGRSLLAKTLGVSQLIYAASVLSVPTPVIKEIQAELFNFLWKNKKDKIKRLVLYQPLAEGGLNFVNFPAVVKSLRLAWISRFLSNS